MIASDFRERVDVEDFTTTNTKGVKTKAWAADATDVPAHIRFEDESERVRAGRTEAEQAIIVTMRSEITITAKKRLKWDSDYWQVAGFPRTIDAMRRFIRFPAVRTDADEAV